MRRQKDQAMIFQDTETGRRVSTYADMAYGHGDAERMREKIDAVTESIYQLLPSGDYGRGDVRRELLRRLDELEGGQA